MQRYQWPGYELQLLGELQRQQNSAQYCDTLLQTEGISVPTHSCVLAALSPYFSQELSATPSPPRGQKRHLHLRELKAQTLLKLVGLLYSGELEVKGPKEQNDVLVAAHRFGLADLVAGRRYWRAKEEEHQKRRERAGCCRENGAHTERCRQKLQNTQDAQVQADMTERRDKPSLETQKCCVSKSTQTVEAAEESAGRFIDQNKPHGISCDQQFGHTPCLLVPCLGESAFKSAKTPTSASVLSNKLMTFSNQVSDDCSSMSTQDDVILQESFESEDCIQVSVSEDARLEGGEGQDNSDGKTERQNLTGKRPPFALAGRKSLKTMKEMIETAHISVKVKLRKRTEEEVWEVVSVPDSEDNTSVQASGEQDHLSLAAPQMSVEDVQPVPSSDILYAVPKPQTRSPHLNLGSSEQVKLDGRGSSSGRFASHPDGELECIPPPPPPQGPAEESEEQIEKLLEDIMMGLNILPNFERDCKKTQPTDSGFHGGLAAVSQPCCTRLYAPQPEASRHHRDGMSCRDLLSPQSPRPAYRDGAAATSLTTPDFFSSGQRFDDPTFQQPPSQDDQHILDFLPHSSGNAHLFKHPFPLIALDELRLPECLSPLVPSTSRADYQLLPDNPEPQPLIRRRPWLAEDPGSVQFPLNKITHGEGDSASPTHNTSPRCWLSPENRERPSATESPPKETNGRSNYGQNCSDIPIRRKRIGRNYPQTSTCCILDCKDLNDVKKSVCSVNLSSNNVLADTVSPKLPETARAGTMRSEQLGIRTRSSVKRSLEAPTVAVPQRVVLEPVARRAATLNRQDGVQGRRKRGRPRKVKLEETLSDSHAPVVEIKSDDVEGREGNVDGLPKEDKPKTKRRCKKRKRNMSDVEVLPLKKSVNAERADAVKADGSNNIRNPDALQKPRMVTIKEIQMMLERQHSNATKSNSNQEGNNLGDGVESEAKAAGEKTDDLDVETAGKMDQSDTEVAISEESGGIFRHVGEEESGAPSAEGEETLHRAEGSDHVCLGGTFQENKTASEHKSHLQQREEKGRRSPNAEGSTQDKEEVKEEEDEEEVDVLICSPERTPEIRWCEDVIQHIVISDEEEEEEEEEEIDVTVDE